MLVVSGVESGETLSESEVLDLIVEVASDKVRAAELSEMAGRIFSGSEEEAQTWNLDRGDTERLVSLIFTVE